ncbi:MAG: Asp-tRNA(Asn)/Glu-tRNA(Gln) amidotransferase subunit GatB [Candidatus Latescibacterota bacterium]|nr:MAG: Asp-tRNA(Asn)/Glu-tRNA(Gln) amidotransferase subunit GatB [Candidatus Latescibacterota bacterium]
MRYEAVIGLEVHAQLLTQSKIFCACSTRFGAAANTQTCPVCTGMPGVLPVLNEMAVEYAVRMGMATACTIRQRSRFARKNYFYPDLPKGYQISQFEEPLCTQGHLTIETQAGERTVRIERIHLEEDAGKTLHDQDPDSSLVDLNRTGTPLIEIVSEPDLRDPLEAHAYLAKLKQILVYLEICDGNMEEGSLRCDANVSLRPVGESRLGTKTEIKNLNSFKGVEAALRHEIERQAALLDGGERVVQETRLWDAQRGETRVMRSKEEAHDYRYFPEPDLLPLVLDAAWLERVRAALPELPDAKRERFQVQYSLGRYDAHVLTGTQALADYYESAVAAGGEPKRIANWVQTELQGLLNARGIGIEASPISAASLSELVRLIEADRISGKMAKEVFAEMQRSGEAPGSIVERRGMQQISDRTALLPVVQQILAANPGAVEKYRDGKTKLLGFFVGQAMKATRGRANPQELEQLLRESLDSS